MVSIALWELDAVVLLVATTPLILIGSGWMQSPSTFWLRVAWSALGVVLVPNGLHSSRRPRRCASSSTGYIRSC